MSKQTYSKSKGRAGESAAIDYLRLRGLPAERRRQTGAQDCGDVGGVDGFCGEVKSEKRINLAGYMDELAKESEAAALRFGGIIWKAAIVKRKGDKFAGNWYATMTLADLVDLMERYAPHLFTLKKTPKEGPRGLP